MIAHACQRFQRLTAYLSCRGGTEVCASCGSLHPSTVRSGGRMVPAAFSAPAQGPTQRWCLAVTAGHLVSKATAMLSRRSGVAAPGKAPAGIRSASASCPDRQCDLARSWWRPRNACTPLIWIATDPVKGKCPVAAADNAPGRSRSIRTPPLPIPGGRALRCRPGDSRSASRSAESG